MFCLRALTRSIVAAALFALAACSAEPFKGADIGKVEWGGDFELTAHTGQRLKVSNLTGKVVVLFFGFTNCPDICPPTLVRLSQSLKLLGSDAARVQVLFVTVDPRRDTGAQLAKFVLQFHPAFLGLTGTPQELAAVARDYRISAEADAGHPGHIPHSDVILVKDTRGKLRLLFKGDATAEDIAHDLGLLLTQS